MLWFVGLGISGFRSIPNEAIKIISNADMIYLEQFTSPINKTDIAKIKTVSRGKFLIVKRWMVEDGSQILKHAKKNKVVLLSYGDPYIATTHAELKTRAIREGIRTHSIHASSSLTSVVGECGLHFYKVGRIATIMSETKSLVAPYHIIYRNIIEGYHTVLLLEYDQDRDFFLDPKVALYSLIKTEKSQKRNVVTKSTFAIVASRIGFRNPKITCGNISSLLNTDFGKPPHTIIIPGRLHFTEADALTTYCIYLDKPRDNSDDIKKIAVQMIEKYVPMVRESLEEIKPHCQGQDRYDIILENAEMYVRDAEKFLEDGNDEIAILSIGYADGLVDALWHAKGLKPKM